MDCSVDTGYSRMRVMSKCVGHWTHAGLGSGEVKWAWREGMCGMVVEKWKKNEKGAGKEKKIKEQNNIVLILK